jgi:hypothetical protein
VCWRWTPSRSGAMFEETSDVSELPAEEIISRDAKE